MNQNKKRLQTNKNINDKQKNENILKRVSIYQIKTKHPMFSYADSNTFYGKNLYNLANYYIRQCFINHSKDEKDLTQEQKDTMLKYFGVNKDEVVILEVNNQEERKYLQGVATEAQLGKKTYSCAYVEPTKSGSGINVKTANITWATPAMVATTLSTAGLTDADVVIAANFPVSGTVIYI